jgi:putative ATP-dependent endonuclease of the OLD family
LFFLCSADHSIDFALEFAAGLTYRDFLTGIRFTALEKGERFNIEDCGTGVQSLAIIALYRLLASLRGTNIIIGIEEPETNLHPQAQRELVASLQGATDDGIEVQLIVTSHSTVVIDQIEHQQIVLFRKVDDKDRGFKTLVSQIPNDFWTRNGIEELRYYKFHKYRNSDFFFARLVVLVESSNDAEVVRLLLHQRNIDIDKAGVSILNLEGVKNLKYPLHLLLELGIPYFLIVDKDHFIPYSNDDLDASRYENGFPKYRYHYKADCLIEQLVPNLSERAELLKRFRSNHSSALDLLQSHNMICMNYSLEADLVASRTARDLFYNRLNISSAERSTHELLVNRKKQIKRLDNLLYVVNQTPHKNLPNSYKRIKKLLPAVIRQQAEFPH